MPARASLSLERKLPLLISVLLVALAGGLTAAGYHEVRQASELRSVDRLQRLTTQLAELAATGSDTRLAAMRRVAADTAIVEYLASPLESNATLKPAALAAFAGMSIGPADTGLVAELRSTHEATRVATRPELEADREPVATLMHDLSRGEAKMGDLYSRGDSVFYWVGAPVTGNGRILGYLVQRRTVSSNPRTERQIRELNGSDSVSIFFTSDSSAIWASLTGKPLAPPATVTRDADAPNVVRYARNGNDYVSVIARVPNTPLQVVAEVPYSSLLERPSTFLQRSVTVALAMLIIGILAAWVLSRRITHPILDLTRAAEAISTGHYGQRAAVDRPHETGRLAEAFNTMAEQVQRSHEDLERQIAESRMLATRLEEANRAKGDFLATMSHELRTPLNAIGGYVDLMELGLRGPLTEDQKRDLERVRFNQRHLLSLIGNILDFTRLEAHKLPFEIADVRVDEAVTDVLTAVAPLLDEKQLRRECVGCDQPLLARADRARLDQILINLLSNGIRFTPAGGSITIQLRPHGNRVELVVTDSGIGIPREKLGAIFEPFVQINSGLTRTVGGTGLGLTISRELARGMGGDLTAKSDGATGAQFTLTLPVVSVSGNAERQPDEGVVEAPLLV
jgi:signal transduction histidine kinase